MRWPWTTFEDKVARKTYELALAELVDREQRLNDVRRYLIPMSTWTDLDAHAKGHVEIMLSFTNYRKP